MGEERTGREGGEERTGREAGKKRKKNEVQNSRATSKVVALLFKISKITHYLFLRKKNSLQKSIRLLEP